jgi:hypothetical protein
MDQYAPIRGDRQAGVQRHRNLVAASGMSGHVYLAPTTAERLLER